jgi:phosphate starvation-inducible protein PhoH and related proteins
MREAYAGLQNDQAVEVRIVLDNNQEASAIFGKNDEYLKLIIDQFEAHVVARSGELIVTGSRTEADQLEKLFGELIYLYRSGITISAHDIQYAIRLIKEGQKESLHAMLADTVIVTHRGKQVKPKTLNQKRYLEAIRKNFIVFGIGPAGTGKTYLAIAMAVFSLKNREVERIILTRPAVEAGEKLGFLPGDLQEKVDPYLRPLYDALFDILGTETFQKYMAKGIIEVAPLAYMRGRTLDDSFIILDEAQNTTPEQMKMFLTRLGFGSKAVITGDVTQVDLPHGKGSGLKHAQVVLKDVQGVDFIPLTDQDVVRHPVVGRIIRAYDRFERENQKG